jgi:hypothetical protein
VSELIIVLVCKRQAGARGALFGNCRSVSSAHALVK